MCAILVWRYSLRLIGEENSQTNSKRYSENTAMDL